MDRLKFVFDDRGAGERLIDLAQHEQVGIWHAPVISEDSFLIVSGGPMPPRLGNIFRRNEPAGFGRLFRLTTASPRPGGIGHARDEKPSSAWLSALP
jgi:hypothetical protein